MIFPIWWPNDFNPKLGCDWCHTFVLSKLTFSPRPSLAKTILAWRLARGLGELDYNIWAAAQQNQQNDLCAQRRLRSALASAQSNQSSLCTQWVAEDPMFHHADSEDFDQTRQMPRLIRVFAVCTCHSVGFFMRRLISHCVKPKPKYGLYFGQ